MIAEAGGPPDLKNMGRGPKTTVEAGNQKLLSFPQDHSSIRDCDGSGKVKTAASNSNWGDNQVSPFAQMEEHGKQKPRVI